MRTRLRRLRIGADSYVWRAEIWHSRGTACHRCIRVRAWGAGRTGRALQADLLSTAWGTPWDPCATDGAHPTPSDVHALILFALAHGWHPQVRGGTFRLTEAAHGDTPIVPGFLLTDRLVDPSASDPTPRVIRAAAA